MRPGRKRERMGMRHVGEQANATLPPRANIALLTLQLRASLRDAEEAERAERVWDGEAAASELRERLDPMVRDQSRTFEVELWQARAAASARVEAVREELAARRASEACNVPAEPPAPEPPAHEPAVAADHEVVSGTEDAGAVAIDADVVEEVGGAGAAAGRPLAAPAVDAVPIDRVLTAEPSEAHVVESDLPDDAVPHESPHVVGSSPEDLTGTRDDSGAAWSRPAPESAGTLTADDVRSIVDEAIDRFAARQAASQPSSGMDPEAFSRAFAAAFGAAFSAMLDERVAALNAGPAVAPPWVRYAPQPPVEIKQSFWTNMWHADVMLSVLAAVIVLVVLIAWST